MRYSPPLEATLRPFYGYVNRNKKRIFLQFLQTFPRIVHFMNKTEILSHVHQFGKADTKTC